MQLKPLIFLAAVVSVVFITGCVNGSQEPRGVVISDKEFTVSVNLPSDTYDSISRATIEVSAEDIDVIIGRLSVENQRVFGTISNVPLGNSRHIVIKVFNKDGLLIFTGEGTTDVVSDEPVYVTIVLKRVTGTIVVNGITTEPGEFIGDYNTLALYHCNETNGDMITDATGRWDGVIGMGSRTDGVFGNGLSFNPEQYAGFSYGDIIPDGTPEGTVECYVSFNSDWNVSGNYAIFGNNGARCLLIYKAGKLSFLKNHSNIFKTVTGAAELVADRWYHLAATWGSNGMRIFLDGELIGSNQDTSVYQSSPRGNSENYFYIGMKTYDGMEGVGISGTSYFNGKIDEIRISDIERY